MKGVLLNSCQKYIGLLLFQQLIISCAGIPTVSGKYRCFRDANLRHRQTGEQCVAGGTDSPIQSIQKGRFVSYC